MTNQMISRTQRRMEKKQTLMVLTLLLVGCLVSFSLGVMVGRSGDDVVVEEQMAQQRPATVIADDAEEGPSATALSEGAAIDTELTFYDTLPKGQDNALGSGINLPPEEKKAKEPATATSSPPIKESAPTPVPVVVREPQPPVSGPMAVKQPEPAAVGDFLIQVASVKDRQGALDLRSLMISKGYAAFVESADLGAKGVWHRVYAGPFSSKEEAEKKAVALKNDRISSAPFIRRR